MEIARALVQTACSALKVFFYMVGLTISAVKSEAMVFSRKHHKSDVTLWNCGYVGEVCLKPRSSNILASSLIMGYAGVHKYGTYKGDCKD
jgi:hypothetical protein